MPKDLWITMLATIAAGVITHQVNQSDLVATITQNMGKVMRKLVSFAARFGATLFILAMCVYQIISFAVTDDPVGRWGILGAIYFSVLGLEFVKFLLNDIHDVRSGRKPL
ncbi:hypothetical protein [Pseudomonas petrae]|uniref:hypothetical protein n=1 Tax=Pseudomonas petrae TaxID=2912190 RepID=UPI001F2B191C|nr:hypothetical protein [Pseudomonas petrae]MCF7532020.1 hypothetical protein [Pseudomonas petrae]